MISSSPLATASPSPNTSLPSFLCVTDRVSHFIIQILKEFDWHHVALIVDETDWGNTLIRRSLETVFKQDTDANRARGTGIAREIYDIKLDVQSFTYRNFDGDIVANRTIDFKKILQAASRSARGEWHGVP